MTPKQKEVLEFILSFGAKKGYPPSQQEIARHFGFRSLGTVQNYLVRLERQGYLAKTWNARRGLRVFDEAVARERDGERGSSFARGAGGMAESASAPRESMISKEHASHSTLASRPAFAPRESISKEHASHSTLASRPTSAPRESIPLPLLGRVAAGRPIEAVASEETLEVPVSLLRRSGEHFVLRVQGDSMIDQGILHGDYVVLRQQKQAENGQTVVALVGGAATIKRFYRKAGGIELRAANPAYDPILVESMTDSASPDFEIAGVLVGLIRRLD